MFDLGNLNLNNSIVDVIKNILSSGKDLFSLDELKSLAGSNADGILKKLHDAKALIPTTDGEKPDLGKLKEMLSELSGNLGNLGGIGNLFK